MAHNKDELPKQYSEEKWIIPPGLRQTLKKFNAYCDAYSKLYLEGKKPNPFLIHGESGVGKSMFVDYFIEKYKSQVTNQNSSLGIATINCATIPMNLLESELFGHVKGAFTGADKKRDGAFAKTNNGIVVLEEIGEIDSYMQAKLLMIIETGKYKPLGADKEENFNGRIVATTNQTDLRNDLWNRFTPLYVPPLYKRRIDILYYLYNFDKEALETITRDMVLKLFCYNWRGNVREIDRLSFMLRVNQNFYASLTEVDLRPVFPDDKNFQLNVPIMDIQKEDYYSPIAELTNATDIDISKFVNKIIDNQKDINNLSNLLNEFKIDIYHDHELYSFLFDDVNDTVIDLEYNLKIDKYNNLNRFEIWNCGSINEAYIGFVIFCYLFFKDFKSEEIITESKNTLPDTEKISNLLKNYNKLFQDYNIKNTSFNIFKNIFKIEHIFKFKKLPINDKRSKIIEKIYEYNKDNKHLSSLLNKDSNSETQSNEEEIPITQVSSNDLESYYLETLYSMGKNQKTMAEISGQSKDTVGKKMANYGLKQAKNLRERIKIFK